MMNKYNTARRSPLTCLFASLFLSVFSGFSAPSTCADIEAQPLPAGASDNGINVLFDFAHESVFYWMWVAPKAAATS